MRLTHALAALAALASLSNGAAHAQATATPKNVVLVHGLYADGSSWSKVIPLLQAKGLKVTSVQNPLTSFKDDVDAVKRTIEAQDGPTVLVGHSYAGMVISEAGTDAKVSALVYVAARAPDAGEDYPALTKKYPAAPAGAGLRWDAYDYGRLTEPAFVEDFAGDLPKEEARALFAVQQPFSKAITMAKTSVAAWKLKPSWYVVARDDRTINPDLQRFMATRMNAKATELSSSHVPMLSRPAEVAEVILKAVEGAR